MGSFYRVDDRTGFPTRAEKTRKEWNGLIVDDRVWEERHPQDLVKGVPDYQAVPDARSLAPNVFIGPTFIQLSAAAAVGASVLALPSLRGLSVGTPVSVMLDSGANFNTTVQALGVGTVTLAKPLPSSAAAGNLLTINTVVPTAVSPLTTVTPFR
jgi:hypothetical protein